MAERSVLPAYFASFRMGAMMILRDRGEMVSKLIIYAVLLLIFYSIFSIMPLDQLGMPNLTPDHLLWYFAVTEIVIVGTQGARRDFGRAIAAGQLTSLMQRPGNMLVMFTMRLLGGYAVQVVLFLVATMAVLPLIGLPMTMPLSELPILLLMLTLAGIITLLLGYLSSLFEVLGPYSQPVDWILHKFVMAFGGLFFPVSLFPPLMRDLVMLTPFPSILYAPGSLMLGAGPVEIMASIAMQLFWLVVLGALAVSLEGRVVRHVMRVGD